MFINWPKGGADFKNKRSSAAGQMTRRLPAAEDKRRGQWEVQNDRKKSLVAGFFTTVFYNPDRSRFYFCGDNRACYSTTVIQSIS